MFHKHRALIGYLFIVVIAVVALEIHVHQINSELSDRDRHSCDQRNALARNQVAVLKVVVTLVRQEITEDEHSKAQLESLRIKADDLVARLKTAAPRPC